MIKILNAAAALKSQIPQLQLWHDYKIKYFDDLATSNIFLFPECFWGGNVSIAHCPAFRNHIEIVESGDYEFVWARNFEILQTFRKHHPTAKCFLATDECTDDTHTQFIVDDTRIFNAVNKKAHTTNYGWLWMIDGIQNHSIQRGGQKKAVTLMHKNIKPLLVDGVDVSLKQYRTNLALELFSHGLCDIYGNGFSQSLGTTAWRPLSNRWAVCEIKPCPKIAILSQYRYNLCLENTLWPYFVSEKIWQSIAGGCIPIYVSDTIHEDFDKDIIIDPRDYESTDDLIRFLVTMPDAEYYRRINACIDIMMSLLNNNTIHKLCESATTNFLQDLSEW